MLIVFEGIDGSGKNTQIDLLRKELDFVYFKYPTKKIELLNLYLEKKVSIHPLSLFFLFLADIASEQEILREALKSKKVVVLDRYVYSTISYEIKALDFESAKKIIELSNFIKPDIVFYLDVDPKVAQERKRTQKNLDLYEEDLSYLSKVRENYLKLYRENFYANKWFLIDANKNIDLVQRNILSLLP